MTNPTSSSKRCLIIGASHGGVNCAFALRKEGWEGEIVLFDKDPALPYHRPPLSKAFLLNGDNIENYQLKSRESYQKENIHLELGKTVTQIDPPKKYLLVDGEQWPYDKLVLATGARPFIPPILGIDKAKNLFVVRQASDSIQLKEALRSSERKRVVVIGGGYIGLETAASLKKLGANVVVLEREERILSRVTMPAISSFFQELHTQKGVEVFTQKNVVAIEQEADHNLVNCGDGSSYEADIIIVGVGIKVNLDLAKEAGLSIENGIRVDARAQTSDKAIYAIGDCTYHHNPHYDRFLRLESVQNAVDQAKVAAAAICGKDKTYQAIPWFWSDQYEVKMQMVGLSDGHTEAVSRTEMDAQKFSIWYFKADKLVAVDAINNPKAYVLGTKIIKQNKQVDKEKLTNPNIDLKQVIKP